MVREIAGLEAANRGFAIAERNMVWVESGWWRENGKGRLVPWHIRTADRFVIPLVCPFPHSNWLSCRHVRLHFGLPLSAPLIGCRL